jgi:hypothetical protein
MGHQDTLFLIPTQYNDLEINQRAQLYHQYIKYNNNVPWDERINALKKIPVEGEIFRTCPDRSWGPPSLLFNGYRVFPGVKSGRGVTLTPHPLLVPWSWKGTAIPLLHLWAVRPVQSLSACTRVHITFIFTSTCGKQMLWILTCVGIRYLIPHCTNEECVWALLPEEWQNISASSYCVI